MMITTPPPRKASIVPLAPATFRARIDELLSVYCHAMRYPYSTVISRKSHWLEATHRPGFHAHAVILHPEDESPDPDRTTQKVVGIAYAFTGTSESTFYRWVHTLLQQQGTPPTQIRQLLGSYSEIAEVHVHPDYQGRSLGEEMLKALLGTLNTQHALLSTPECKGESNGAWRLYRKLGFYDLLRQCSFPTDPRLFGILALNLPQRTMS